MIYRAGNHLCSGGRSSPGVGVTGVSSLNNGFLTSISPVYKRNMNNRLPSVFEMSGQYRNRYFKKGPKISLRHRFLFIAK